MEQIISRIATDPGSLEKRVTAKAVHLKRVFEIVAKVFCTIP